MPSRLGLLLGLLLIAACSAGTAYWGNTPQYVRNQLDAADRLMQAGEREAGRARFEQMAETGHPEALIRAGRAWLAGPDADPARARQLFEAAWTRNSARRDQAGLWLARSIAEEDPEGAIALLERVAGKGERGAAGELARQLTLHHPDDPRIVGLLRRAGAEGEYQALLTLARDHGDAEALPGAVRLLEARHAAGDLHAANHLARLHAADGPLADPAAEMLWLRRAAERGHAGAMLNYGRALLAGEVVARDQRRGIGWVRRSAEAGNHWAQLELGRRLARGDGVTTDPREGRLWLERAAAQGNQQAERALAGL